MIRPKQSQGQYSPSVSLGNEDLSYLDEFHYLWHNITANCRNDEDIEKQFRTQTAVN